MSVVEKSLVEHSVDMCKTPAMQCTGRDKNTCFNDPGCYWSGSSCTLGAEAAQRAPTALPPQVPQAPIGGPSDAGGSAHGKTPVLYSCTVAGAPGPIEGLTWVDTLKAKMGTAGPDVERVARSKANASSAASTTCSVSVQPMHDAKEWLHRRMASNCAPRFDLNDITTINHFTCSYEGSGVIDGKRVRRPNYELKGRLASCDGYNEYMETSDEVMESIRMYAYDRAGGQEAQMDPSQFVCSVQSLPHH